MGKSFPAEVKPTAQRVADWVEFRSLQQSRTFKRGDLRSAIQIEDVANPELLEVQVWKVLQDRAELFRHNWPLRLKDSRITRARGNSNDLNLYRYLLMLGMGEIDDVDRQLFELIVADIMVTFTQSPSLRLGAPAHMGMSASFRARVDSYAAAAGLVPDIEYVSRPLPNDQDFGLDVASWFPFEDNRSGTWHVLAQCATGDDWDSKLDELHIAAWSQHINWAVPPLRVFCVPIAVVLVPAKWIRTCRRAGLMLDRPRLMELARRKPIDAALAALVRRRLRILAG